jgi:hypothetical protein
MLSGAKDGQRADDKNRIALPWYARVHYSLRPIILFFNMDVSRHILVVDTFVLAKSNMGRSLNGACCVVYCRLQLAPASTFGPSCGKYRGRTGLLHLDGGGYVPVFCENRVQ